MQPRPNHALQRTAPRVTARAFCERRGSQPDIPPDVYIVPATTIIAEYKGANIRQHSFFRHHRAIEHMAPFKNEWKPIIKALS